MNTLPPIKRGSYWIRPMLDTVVPITGGNHQCALQMGSKNIRIDVHNRVATVIICQGQQIPFENIEYLSDALHRVSNLAHIHFKIHNSKDHPIFTQTWQMHHPYAPKITTIAKDIFDHAL